MSGSGQLHSHITKMQVKAEISVNGWLYWTGFVGKNTGVKSSWPCFNLCFLIVCACYDVYRGILFVGDLGAPWALSVRGRALLVPGSGFFLFQTHTQHCAHRATRLRSFQKIEFWRILGI